MSDTSKKISLLNTLDIIQGNNNKHYKNNVYYFNNVGEIIINNIYMIIPNDVALKVSLKQDYISFSTLKELQFVFQIDYKDLENFHLLVRGE